jgi:bifunctional DNase/RNase
MIETIVDSIRVNLVTQNRVLFLREVEGDRHLPIWIGEFEAHAIAMELQGMSAQRPMPYDLIKALVGSSAAHQPRHGHRPRAGHLLRQGRRRGRRPDRRDRLPAERRDRDRGPRRCPILVDDLVMDRAGISIATDDDGRTTTRPAMATTPSRRPAGVFREFINTLDLDDFEKRSSSS